MILIKKTGFIVTTTHALIVMRIPENTPPEHLPLAQHASDNMLIFTAVLATLIGIILFLLGRKGKQLWMATWGIGLIICSILLGIFTLSG